MLDCEFHLQMVVMSGNEVLRYLLRRNFEHIILRTRLDNYVWVKWENSINDLGDLMEKIKARNFPSGAEILIRHIRDARDNVLSSIRGEDQEGNKAYIQEGDYLNYEGRKIKDEKVIWLIERILSFPSRATILFATSFCSNSAIADGCVSDSKNFLINAPVI